MVFVVRRDRPKRHDHAVLWDCRLISTGACTGRESSTTVAEGLRPVDQATKNQSITGHFGCVSHCTPRRAASQPTVTVRNVLWAVSLSVCLQRSCIVAPKTVNEGSE